MQVSSSYLPDLFAWRHDKKKPDAPYDATLLMASLALMAIGLVMVTSASMPVAARLFDNPFHFSIRHGIYIVVSLFCAMVTLMIPMSWWQKTNGYLLCCAILLLILVLLVGRTVNGSTRWLAIGPLTFQAAEPAKLYFFCYLAGYMVRRYGEVTENLKGFIKPLIVFFVLALLLLAQPDLGTVIVMFATTVGLLFLAGAKLWQFFGLAFTGIAAVVALIVFEEYRMRRVTAFLDPWADPFGSGYQLTQSLMAWGRGNWLGEGLGNSLQKLEFLPEAHTDFIMSIVAEELGLMGVLLVLALILTLVVKSLQLGNRALQQERAYEGFMAYSIGIWISFQTAVNVGASSGVLPTKGLTLPLVSSGGSSLIIMSVAVAILLRIDFELKTVKMHALSKGNKSKGNKTTQDKKRHTKMTKVATSDKTAVYEPLANGEKEADSDG